jgi:predicted acylesterase/phospholipase RssA
LNALRAVPAAQTMSAPTNWNMWRNLVVSGGAFRAVAIVGCLRRLHEDRMLDHIHNYVGSSAGAVLCLLLVLGYTPAQIQELACDSLSALMQLDVDDLLALPHTFGMDSGRRLEGVLRAALQRSPVGASDATFLELAKVTGKHLVVTVSNVTRRRPEYWSVDTVPTMSVVTAARASCALPLLYAPVLVGGDVFLDGGLYDDMPLTHALHAFPSAGTAADTLAIYLAPADPPAHMQQDLTAYIEFVVSGIIGYRAVETQPSRRVVMVALNPPTRAGCFMSILHGRDPLTAAAVKDLLHAGYTQTAAALTGCQPVPDASAADASHGAPARIASGTSAVV